MSYSTLNQASQDVALQERTIACVNEQAVINDQLAGTTFGETVRLNPAQGIRLTWPVAIDNQAAYASAIAAGNPNPGGDDAVITDAMILAAVQAHWPDDTAP